MPIGKNYIKIISQSILYMLITDFLAIWLSQFVKTDADYSSITNKVYGTDVPHSIIIPIAVLLCFSALFIKALCLFSKNKEKSYYKMFTCFLKYKVLLFTSVQYFLWYFFRYYLRGVQVENIHPVQASNEMISLTLKNSCVFLLLMYVVFIIVIFKNREKYKLEMNTDINNSTNDLLSTNIIGLHK